MKLKNVEKDNSLRTFIHRSLAVKQLVKIGHDEINNVYPFRRKLRLPLSGLLLFLAITIFSSVDHLVDSSDARPDKVLELTSDNYDTSTSKYQIVVLNFYADWCPYSARWKPVFQETAKFIYNETKDYDPNTIVFGQINCVEQTTLSQRFRITKFPTTKMTINGKACKKEYRGARNTEAFREYVKKFLADPIINVNSMSDLGSKVEERKGAFIMYSARLDEHGDRPVESTELQVFRKVAQQLREDCQFLYVLGSASSNKVTPPDMYTIAFKPHHKGIEHEVLYRSSITDLETLSTWTRENCIPLVREITFENAEEMTEVGLPFVILFFDPNDKSWIEVFKRVVEQELRPESNSVTFLYADGHVFSHPLKHLGKTTKDLPVVAIDSFKHLFLYKQPVASISQPGKLKQFIADLHSGKLDREFHFGPDPVSQTSPPESAFNKLQPSAYRYSLLMPRDEL